MIRVARTGAIAAWIACTMTGAAVAQDAPAKPAKGSPNEVVCEKIEIVGSRLGSKRVCRTRAEWAEQRRTDREMVDRSQIRGCDNNSGC